MNTDRTKIQSPHPGLQSVLSRLSVLNPVKKDDRHVFETREEAEQFIRSRDEDFVLNPIWGIDHSDLQASQITGWSYTRHPC